MDKDRLEELKQGIKDRDEVIRQLQELIAKNEAGKRQTTGNNPNKNELTGSG